MATTMAADNNDNEVDGDGATGDNDGDGATGDDNDNEDDGTTMTMATARWATAQRDTMTTTMAKGDVNDDIRRPTTTNDDRRRRRQRGWQWRNRRRS
jgi:hypothetical protein